jgi:signal transduction histidine kinase
MQIALTLALLAAGLVAAVVFQVRFGLRPLHRLRMALSGVRSGQSEELQGRFPGEVQPLVEELNALLARNAAMLERARAQAADLAHALKNPLTVIKNEARTLHGPAGEILRKEAAAMAAAIDRHLSRARARAAGARAHPAQRTPVDAVVDDLRYSLERLHRDRGLTMDLSGDAGQIFAGEREDLEEMLGNLMDNACKWARQRVQVRVKAGPGRLCIQVEDDGPGVPPARFDEVLERGRRLDETTPGTGMGLAIVRDLAEAYGGAIALSPSPLGGLCASLTLPAHSGQGRGTAGPE